MTTMDRESYLSNELGLLIDDLYAVRSHVQAGKLPEARRLMEDAVRRAESILPYMSET